MTKPNVLVMSETWPSALETLASHCTLHDYDKAEDKTGLLKSVGPLCEAVIITGHTTLGEHELQHLPNLEIVACSSAGFEALDHRALVRRGIALTNSSIALKDDVADTALMLTLAARKELIRADDYVRSGAWGKNGPYPLLSTLTGCRAGLLGFGTIGQEIAARLQAFKLEIGYCTRRPRDVEFAYFPDAAALAEWADILIVGVPGGAETAALVDAEVLRRLGPTGTLINIARGSVIDEAALIAALKDGTLGSAGLDVFLNEPDPDPELTSLPNVVLFPHHASGTTQTRAAMAHLAVDNLLAHFANQPLISPVQDGPAVRPNGPST